MADGGLVTPEIDLGVIFYCAQRLVERRANSH